MRICVYAYSLLHGAFGSVRRTLFGFGVHSGKGVGVAADDSPTGETAAKTTVVSAAVTASLLCIAHTTLPLAASRA